MADTARKDQNSVATLLGTSSSDQTPVAIYADPVTHRLLVDATGTGGSGITSINADTTAAQILAAGTNITITDNGTGTHTISATGGSGTPGGLNAQIQYNNAGAFGGITGATTDGTAVSLTAAHLLNPTINGAGTGLATLAYPNTSSSATITLPTVTGTLATLAGTETLTNKTLTAPTITGATITTSTVNGVTLTTGGGTTTFLNANGVYSTPAGAGTVTSVSVVPANGFAGTVATATSTPAITLTTSITGVLKGNATAISAATLGTDYSGGTSALTTGILKSTTTTGALTIAVAADFPTLNQNTTGSAATLTTARTIGIATGDATSAGSTFDGSANNTNALTLATVNTNVGSFTNANITVNAKGLITAAANGSAGTGTVTSVAQTVPAFLSITGSPVTTSGTLAIGFSGTALPIANGGTGVTSVTVTPTATSFAGWDGNVNMSASNFIEGFTTTATSGGSTTLTVASTYQQDFTGAANQTVVLPVASTMVLGQQFFIRATTTGAVTVQSSGGNTVVVLASTGTSALITCKLTSGTTAASWDVIYYGFGIVSGKIFNVNNSLLFLGTDATQFTFPTTNDTVVGIAATQTLTNKTLTSPVLTTPVINGTPTGTGVSATPTASIIPLFDANKNLSANNFLEGFTTTATAAGTTVLTVASTEIQQFTGSTTQIVTLPTTSIVAGTKYHIENSSSGIVTVNASGGALVFALAAGTSAIYTALVATPTTAANWFATPISAFASTGKIGLFTNSLTLSGVDGTTLTFQGTDTYVGRTTTDTLTNKRITRRLTTTNAPGASPSTNTNNVDIQSFTGIATAITSMTTNLSGAASDGDLLEFRFLDAGTAETIGWGASFAATTVALPTTTVISTTLRVLFEWRAASSKWECLAVA